MLSIVLLSVGLITISHRLVLPFRNTGEITYQTAYDIFSVIMHATIFLNLFLLFQWIGLVVAIILLFFGGIISIPFGLIVVNTKISPKGLTGIFAIFSWLNIGVTVAHLIFKFL